MAPPIDHSGTLTPRVLLVIGVILVAVALFSSLVWSGEAMQNAQWMMVVLLLSLASLKNSAQSRATVMDLMSVAWITLLIAHAFVSEYIGNALYQVCWFVVLWLAVNLRMRSHRLPSVLKNAMPIVATLVLLMAGAELMQVLGDGTLSHLDTYQVKGPFSDRNVLVQFLVLIHPYFLVQATKHRDRFNTAICLAMAFMVLCLLSRLGWLLLLSQYVLWGLWIYKSGRLRLSRQKLLYWGLGILAVLGIFSVFLDQWYTLWHQVLMTFDLTQGTSRDRMILLESSIQIWLSAPFAGVGGAGWPLAMLPYYTAGMESETAKFYFQHPHNEWVWLLSEYGVLLGGALIACILYAVFSAVKRWIAHPNDQNLAMVLAWFSGIAIAFFAFPLSSPAMVVILGFGVGYELLKAKQIHLTFPKSIPILVGTLCAVFLGFRWIHVQRMAVAESFSASGNEARAAKEMCDVEPMFISYNKQLLTTRQLQRLYRFRSVPEMPCEAYFQFATHHPILNNVKGICAFLQEDYSAALDNFSAATAIAPAYNEAWTNVAITYDKLRKPSAALQALLHAEPTINNRSYDQLAVRLGVWGINQLLPEVEERRLLKTFEAIRNTPHWAGSLIPKAAMNEVSFEKQLHIDAIFYLIETCETAAECDAAEAYRLKYISDIPLDTEVK